MYLLNFIFKIKWIEAHMEPHFSIVLTIKWIEPNMEPHFLFRNKCGSKRDLKGVLWSFSCF